MKSNRLNKESRLEHKLKATKQYKMIVFHQISLSLIVGIFFYLVTHFSPAKRKELKCEVEITLPIFILYSVLAPAGHISASVVATVSRPECYKFHGGILTADGYTWYQLQNVQGHVRYL